MTGPGTAATGRTPGWSIRRVIVLPHTHWDREWYEPAPRFRQGLVPVLDALIDGLENDASFRCFLLDGQAVLLHDYFAVRPAQRARVTSLVRDGRLLVGPWYVLADELLASDEALVRNLFAGKRVGDELGGWLPLGYSPDAFGHPAALPAILGGFGIRHAILWRGHGGLGVPERDLLRWVSPDGSPVLTHHLPPGGYEIGAALPGEDERLLARWHELEGVLARRASAGVLLLLSGADHHAADLELPHKIAALNRLVPGDRFMIGSPLEYFAALPPALSVPEVRGELRASYGYALMLQGVHSTRAELKRAIAEGDRLLIRWAEPQAALSRLRGGPDCRPLLEVAWRDHLLNHPHDSLAGCVSDGVAKEIAVRAAGVVAQARGMLVDAVHDRLAQDRQRARRAPGAWRPTLAVVNPSPWSTAQVVETTIARFVEHVVIGRPASPAAPRGGLVVSPPRVVGPDGEPIPLQVLDAYDAYDRLDSPADYPDQDQVRAFRVALLPGDVPALGLKALRVLEAREEVAARAQALAVRATAAGLDGPHGRVTGGRAAGFSWKDPGRDQTYPDLASVESQRDEGDTYTFQPAPGDRPLRARWSRPRVVWEGPLVAAIARGFAVGDRARGMVYARMQVGSPLLRFVIEGVNLCGNHRLRVRFPLPGGASPSRSLADMQYGWVAREREAFDLAAYPGEWPVATAPMHRYVSVATGGADAGLTVFARGAFEYELCADGAVGVTVFRAVRDLSRGDLPARPGHVAWPVATPAAGEPGRFRLELAVSSMAVSERSSPEAWAALERLADSFHAPCAGLMLRYGIDVPDTVQGPTLAGAGLGFKALKPRDQGPGCVARCVNLTDSVVEGTWLWPVPVSRAFEARLDETPVCELGLEAGGRQVRFRAAPRAPVTIVVEP